MSYHFHPSILRAYDIRGVFGETLHVEDASALGVAFGSALAIAGGTSVAVGQDGRASSPAMAAALCAALASTGLTVRRVGLGPTPMLYFAERHLQTDGAIMVTGSHNPPDHNGFKMSIRGKSLYGDAIRQLAGFAANGSSEKGEGTMVEDRILSAYIDRLVQDASVARPIRVAWDPGNGAAGPAVMALTERLPGEHIVINGNVDESFPNHHPDPADPDTLAQLQETVLSKQCDLGIAFDGDGDRIGVVDALGRIIWGDQLLIFFAKDVLAHQRGAEVIADVKASQLLFDEVGRMGGRALMWKTGHSLIKAKMEADKALLAGEMSGHIYFADRYFGFDDALYAAVRLLNIATRVRGGVTTLRDRLPTVFNTPEIRVPCPEGRQHDIVEKIRAQLEQQGSDVNTIDGVRVRTPEGWWLLRASNTQDCLVVRSEASSPASLQRQCLTLAELLCANEVPIASLDKLLSPMAAARQQAHNLARATA